MIMLHSKNYSEMIITMIAIMQRHIDAILRVSFPCLDGYSLIAYSGVASCFFRNYITEF